MLPDNETNEVEESATAEEVHQALTGAALDNVVFEYEDEVAETPQANRRYNKNVTEDYKTSEILGDDAEVLMSIVLEQKDIIDSALDQLSAPLAEYMRIKSANGNTGEYRYIRGIADARERVVKGGAFRGPLLREGSDWRQYVQIGEAGTESSKHLRPSPFRLKTPDLTGKNAVTAILQAGGSSNQAAYCNAHSGYWYSLETPAGESDLALQMAMSEHINQIGYETNGLAHGAESVMIHKMVANYALRHMVKSTLPNMDEDVFLDNTSIFDLDTLAWSLSAVTWTKGFEYSNPCIDNPDKCNHINKTRADLRNMQWIDNSMFTSKQRSILSRRPPQRSTLEDLEAFRAEHDYENRIKSVFTLLPNIRVHFGVPNLRRYFNCGDAWISKIRQMTEVAFTMIGGDEEVSKSQRISYMNMQAQVTTLQQHVHFVKTLEVLAIGGSWDNPDDVTTYVDPETIADAICGLTLNETVFDNFMQAIEDYSNAAVNTVIGIPTYQCNKCGVDQGQFSKNPDVIPIPVFHLFFTLGAHRLSPVLNRG